MKFSRDLLFAAGRSSIDQWTYVKGPLSFAIDSPRRRAIARTRWIQLQKNTGRVRRPRSSDVALQLLRFSRSRQLQSPPWNARHVVVRCENYSLVRYLFGLRIFFLTVSSRYSIWYVRSALQCIFTEKSLAVRWTCFDINIHLFQIQFFFCLR